MQTRRRVEFAVERGEWRLEMGRDRTAIDYYTWALDGRPVSALPAQ